MIKPTDMPTERWKEHVARYGEFNDYPPGWREITEAEFARSAFFTWWPVMEEFRQMRNPDTPHEALKAAHLLFMHDGTGYAIVNDFWGNKIHFYAFGCEHDGAGDAAAELKKRNIPLFNMQHASLCSKCGWLRITDSSD